MSRRLTASVITLLFLASVAAGLSSPPQQSEGLAEALKEQFRPLTESYSTSDLKSLMMLSLTIFMNNLRVALLNLILGVSVVGPAGVMMVNGYVIGVVLSSMGDVMAGVALILPHGILEISALIYSAVLGTHLGVGVVSSVFRRSEAGRVRAAFRETFTRFPIVVLLLALAALIEVFVTMLIVAPIVRA
ncbi:MAG: stage II sporulation protein M [Zestosphaera sp.]